MGRRSQQKRDELESKYGNGAFAPIAPKYIQAAREKSAKYILFVNKNSKHGLCEKCCKDVEFERATKHNKEIECPNCKAKLIVRHAWRGRCKLGIDWYVVGEVVDSETFALRYIGVYQDSDYTKYVDESAREIYDFKHGWSYKFSYDCDEFRVDDTYYFREFFMYQRRKQCCIGAEAINDIKGKLMELDAFKYFEQLDEYFDVYTYPRDNIKQLLDVPLYEKLEKVGLGKIAQEDYKHYWGKGLIYKRSKTELTKMLGVNKQHLKLLKKYCSLDNLEYILDNKDMQLNILEYLLANNACKTYVWAEQYEPEKQLKLTKYMVNNNVRTYDYDSHIRMMDALGYKIDENYKYPKDFNKEHQRVVEEYNAMLDEERLKRMSKQSKLIKKISDGLRKMPDLQEFLGNSNGLLVYVPESAKDLVTEGRLLHNCIGNYVDRVAEKKTLIFFVRKLSDPTAPFVAFEYADGEVIQCRYDNNRAVKGDTEEGAKILDFVDRFVEQLRKNNVLYKAA